MRTEILNQGLKIIDESIPDELQQLECKLDELEMRMEISDMILKEDNPEFTQNAIEMARGVPEEIDELNERMARYKATAALYEGGL